MRRSLSPCTQRKEIYSVCKTGTTGRWVVVGDMQWMGRRARSVARLNVLLCLIVRPQKAIYIANHASRERTYTDVIVDEGRITNDESYLCTVRLPRQLVGILLLKRERFGRRLRKKGGIRHPAVVLSYMFFAVRN